MVAVPATTSAKVWPFSSDAMVTASNSCSAAPDQTNRLVQEFRYSSSIIADGRATRQGLLPLPKAHPDQLQRPEAGSLDGGGGFSASTHCNKAPVGPTALLPRRRRRRGHLALKSLAWGPVRRRSHGRLRGSRSTSGAGRKTSLQAETERYYHVVIVFAVISEQLHRRGGLDDFSRAGDLRMRATALGGAVIAATGVLSICSMSPGAPQFIRRTRGSGRTVRRSGRQRAGRDGTCADGVCR